MTETLLCFYAIPGYPRLMNGFYKNKLGIGAKLSCQQILELTEND